MERKSRLCALVGHLFVDILKLHGDKHIKIKVNILNVAEYTCSSTAETEEFQFEVNEYSGNVDEIRMGYLSGSGTENRLLYQHVAITTV